MAPLRWQYEVCEKMGKTAVAIWGSCHPSRLACSGVCSLSVIMPATTARMVASPHTPDVQSLLVSAHQSQREGTFKAQEPALRIWHHRAVL